MYHYTNPCHAISRVLKGFSGVRGAQIREEIEQRHAREIAEEVARLQDKVDSERKTRFVSSQSGQHPAVLKMALEIQQVSTESLKFNRGFKKGP
jgi:hypothetical protein